MNTAHWHLMLNHVPVIGIIIGILILAAGFIFKNNITIKQTALGVFIFSALFAIPAYLTGEGAEDAVENIQGVSKDLIDHHEDLGEIFFILTSVLGVLSLVTFIAAWKKKRLASAMYLFVFVTAIITGVLSKQLGTSGGQIRHTEIGNAVQPLQKEPAEKANRSDDE